MARAKRLHHVTVMVTDLEAADAFYGGLIGLAKIQRPDLPSQGIWYEIDGTQVHIILADRSDPPSPRHIAFEVDDLEVTLCTVEKMGLPIWSDIQVEGFVRKHCRDPFGNGIELLQRVESRQERGTPSPSYVNAKGEWRFGEDEFR
ncbi:MAG: hypothetical protein CMJ64_21055 [Planctomycetaceae bacterium]|nr:hypothetical protein [Planctomycetaceae bacterium]